MAKKGTGIQSYTHRKNARGARVERNQQRVIAGSRYASLKDTRTFAELEAARRKKLAWRMKVNDAFNTHKHPLCLPAPKAIQTPIPTTKPRTERVRAPESVSINPICDCVYVNTKGTAMKNDGFKIWLMLEKARYLATAKSTAPDSDPVLAFFSKSATKEVKLLPAKAKAGLEKIIA